MTYIKERRRILVVEDDIDIADLVTIYLHNQNYITHVAYNLEEATKLLEQRRPDLILCDIMLPDGTGTDWIRALRKSADLPVIFLSSRQETEDIVQGLELGDDYITKPFDPDIMVARVKKRLRPAPSTSENMVATGENVWRDGWLDLHFDRFEVRVNGKEISLPAKELQLLFLMASRPGHVFSTDYLFERIWGLDNWSDVRTVMVHLHHLRRKIENTSSTHRYIITVRGIGYKFQAR
ncbi:response regulator transcription factor [Paenibacillus sp. ClWae2A]|uniref:response regulator transcription factor n=1 Tax=Paenibacillus sp. ClWae2A TaxID=3057177 RepID=UPI0028F54E88|nr:response regulator transcription factor [Paenibacillus sp. ClWae2A]MDT9720083.1 response regulator transcription factor [Paenibacillus sp. ClWae2A]